MKQKIKKYIPYVVWTLVGATTLVSIAFVNVKSTETTCHRLNVRVLDADNVGFIDRSDVITLLNECDRNPEGRKLSDINTALLENIIEANPYIENAEVFSSLDGMVNVEVTQRKPILRVCNSSGENFYVDVNGKTMPISTKYALNVITANGNISTHEGNTAITLLTPAEADTCANITVANQLFYIAQTLQCDTFWNAQIVQMFVNERNVIELVPRVGNHIILTGGINSLQEKLNRLYVFYCKGLNKKGWTIYPEIDLSYDGQVIGRKAAEKVEVKNDTTTVH